MKKIKILLVGIILSVLIAPSFASAITLDELQAQIAVLSRQIKELQEQLLEISGLSETTCHQTPLWSWNYATLSCKGNVGEGDCDRHTDCNTGYCARNVGVKYGQVSTMDVCEEKTTPNCPRYAPLNCKQGEKLIVVKEIDPNVECSHPEVKCVPVCDKICKFEGSFSEGWYDSCSKKLIQYANCSPQPSIKVTAPNGGEQYTKGSSILFGWSQNYNVNSVVVSLYSPTISGDLLFSGSSGGSLGKNIGILNENATNVPAGPYKIIICDLYNTNNPLPLIPFKPLCDSSDNYFNIVAPRASLIMSRDSSTPPSRNILPGQTNKETELELLGYLDNINVELSLSPNGKYITKTSYYSPSILPKIEVMSFDNINKLTTLAEGEKDSFMKMIWSDDSSKIAYWTANRGSAPYPSFKVYYLANITGAEPKLMKTYNDMTAQGFINLKKLVSSENRLYLERTKIMNGAPPVWEQDIIEL